MISRTCFLIDDDADDREIFAMAVTDIDKSIRCIFARDGVEALQIMNALETDVPDFIFLDLNMPRMNGKQFLREIKKDGKFRNIPVIIYSTSSEQRDIAEAQSLGAHDFITKPAYLSELRSILMRFFSTGETLT